MKFVRAFLLTLLILAMPACNFTLAEDLTPPPGYVRPTPAPTLRPPYPSAPPDPVNGALLYAEKCAPCHGETGMGDGPQGLQLPVSVTALGLPEIGRAAVPAAWYTVISEGRMEKFMPPFASLSDQERWDVTAYALTLHFAPGDVEAGRALLEASCSECSLALFSDQQEMAALSQADLVRILREGGFNLPAYGREMTENERWRAAVYLRTLSFAASRPAAAAPAATPSLPAETPAPAQPVGTLRGRVFNGSGGNLPAGLMVTLHGLDQTADGGFAEPLTLDAPVRPDGSFIFEDVPMPAGRAFAAALEYDGVEYLSALLSAGEAQRSLDITLYETTTDTTALYVDRWHILLSFDTPGVVQVVELLVISNPENRVVVPAGPKSPVLSFTLPESAANLQFEDGALSDGRYLPTANGFGDLRPIKPGIGDFQVVFAYDLPYTRRIQISRPTDLPVFSALVMAPKSVQVRSDLLQKGGERVFNGVTLSVYKSQPLPAGATLDLEISSAASSTLQGLLFVVGVLGLLLILAGVYMFWRERARVAAEALGSDQLSDRDSVLDAIIALDDLHKAGKLSDQAYQARRSELKSRLQKLL